jgi:hypothetical protein
MKLWRVNLFVMANGRAIDMLRVALGVLAAQRVCQDMPNRGAHRKEMRGEHRTKHQQVPETGSCLACMHVRKIARPTREQHAPACKGCL